MKIYAGNSQHVLISVLQFLERSGWDRADIEKLIDAYTAYQSASDYPVYGSIRKRERSAVSLGLKTDIGTLARARQVQSTVSRVWLLPVTPDVDIRLDALTAPLLRHVSAAFPPRILTAARP